MSAPVKVSVVTVVRNGATTVRDCLASVRRQTAAVEHIVIDGASTDGTLEILRGEDGRGVARLVSEPDEGLYHAMNKGLALATADVVGTLNADDVLADERVIDRVAEAFSDDGVEACYGDLDYVDQARPERVVRRWRSGGYAASKLYRGWMPPHPTFYARRRLFGRHGGFRPELGTAADYELMLRFLLGHGVVPAYIPHVMVRMRRGGASNASLLRRLRANRMDREAWRVNGLKPRPWTILMKPLRKVGQFLPAALTGLNA